MYGVTRNERCTCRRALVRTACRTAPNAAGGSPLPHAPVGAHKLFHKAFGHNQARARPCALTYSPYKFRDLAVKQTVLQLPVKHPVITVGALLVKGAMPPQAHRERPVL